MTTQKTPNKHIFFIGVGGIGMSAVARYFLHFGYKVWGYDKVTTDLTETLEKEGVSVSYQDEWLSQYDLFTPDTTEVVYTPAIPESNVLRTLFEQKGFKLMKRAEALGTITRMSDSLCVAGTHGKSTTSAMVAYLLSNTQDKCNAFLGAIAANFNSNFLIHEKARYTVVEADEFDRSFLHLSPFASIVTNVDPDHLDIYGTHDKFFEGFRQYALKIDPNGVLVVKEGIQLHALCRQVTYAVESISATYSVFNIRQAPTGCLIDIRTPKGNFYDVSIGIAGIHNAENALAAIALLLEIGYNPQTFLPAFESFRGLKRRFEWIYQGNNIQFIDDYAHHPTEINRLVSSLRALYPNKKLIGIFQPHLFTRTRDFGDDFGRELALLDEVILLPIYPAREKPIQTIDSEWLLTKIPNRNKILVDKSLLLEKMKGVRDAVVVCIGAGDIDRLVLPIKEILALNDTQP